MRKPDKFSAPVDISEQTTIPTMPILDIPDLPTIRQPALSSQKQYSAIQEWVIVGLFLAIALLVRLYAAFHTGLEVDEPIYRNAAALALRYGYPSLRPAYHHPVIPFLYHPPFYLFLLMGWFKLWESISYLTGRMLSVIISLIMLLLLYVFTRQVLGRKVVLIALVLVGSDVWIIFTNQAIYLENSLMLLIILAIWVYWHATHTFPSSRSRYLMWYGLAGLLAGCVIIYKQIGGFIVLVVLLNLLLQRKHWIGHAVLCGMMLLVVAGYGLAMHLAFGTLYHTALLDQLYRTLGKKAAPGLNDSVLVALQAIWSRYWIFLVTIVVLLGGSAITLLRYLQGMFRRRNVSQPVIVSWALGGVLFALSISLKSPHYMILWIVPLYLVLAQEIYEAPRNRRSRARLHGFSRRAQALGLLLCVLFLVGDVWGFQARFLHTHGDSLQQADSYINETLPPTAVVLTQNYIGVDLVPQFLDITLITTPQQILQKGVTFMALYWSDTEPISPSLGPVNRYCLPMREFTGFKDHVEVCKIDPIALAAVANPPENPSSNGP